MRFLPELPPRKRGGFFSSGIQCRKSPGKHHLILAGRRFTRCLTRATPPRYADAMIIVGKVIASYERQGDAHIAAELRQCVKAITRNREFATKQGQEALEAFDAGFTKDKLFGRPPELVALVGSV